MRPVDRRTVLKALAAGAVLGGCGKPAAEPGRPSTPASPSAAASKVLLAYFSRPGENYYYGDRTILQVGNTQVVADLIAASAEVDTFRIEAADPYPYSYRETVERNVREQNDEARPAIAGTLPTVGGYGTILLGSPIWNVQPPMIMRTFVESFDLSGKRVFPFVTYAVSGLGRTADDYTRLCPRATIGEGLAVQGERAKEVRAQVDTWLRRIGLS